MTLRELPQVFALAISTHKQPGESRIGEHVGSMLIFGTATTFPNSSRFQEGEM
jgi:hypothetical protein